MNFKTTRRLRVIEFLLVTALAASRALPAFAIETHDFSVPAEGASDAIRDFASQAHVQILAAGENVKNKQLHAVSGTYSTDDGLRILLADSGLAPQYVGDRSIALVSASQTAATEPPKEEAKSSPSFRVAQVDQGPSSAVGTTTQSSSSTPERGAELQEVIVTAQKRAERQLDVPVAMTVLNPQTLAENGQDRMIDYFSTVPGLTLNAGSGGPGTQYLVIRGLSVGLAQNPTVATVIDDIPVGSSTYGQSYGAQTEPDLDPSDLKQIEVLRGPQGTLYGAESLGGLIKYVTADPSTEGFAGRVEASGVDIPDGGLGYAVRGAANVPVSDQFAVRASAFYREDPGYIDYLTTLVPPPPNVVPPTGYELAKRNFNSSDTYGGRLSALWRPSEDFSLKLGAMFEETNGDASQVNSNSMMQFPQGDLNVTGLPGSSQFSTELQFYSAVLTAKVAGLDFTSLTGYSIDELQNYTDISGSGNGVAGFLAQGTGLLGLTQQNHVQDDKLSQEIRLSSSVGRVDWLIGGFYTHENTPDGYGDLYAADLTTGALGPAVFNSVTTLLTFTEYAAFTDMTAHFTDRFDLQVGGRESWHRQDEQAEITGPDAKLFYGVPVEVEPEYRANGNAFTYLVTPSYKISPDVMAYARVASGYRIGGYNTANSIEIVAGVPPTYAPDKTTNYELGIKGELFDRTVSFDVAAYYIDWSDFQITLSKPVVLVPGQAPGAVSYTGNAGNAKSEGVEFSVTARPMQGLTVAAEGAYNDAALTQDIPASSSAYGKAGDPLPYSMRFSGGLVVSQDIHLTSRWTGSIGGAVNYVDSRPYEFVSAPAAGQQPAPRLEFPSYTRFDLRSGVRDESWLFNFYINNVSDRRGVVGTFQSSALGVVGGYYATVIQPRTIGLSVTKTFTPGN